MKNLLNSIRINLPKKNKFNLTHERKFSCNAGDLIPVMVHEALPGDHTRLMPQALIRVAPMIAPVMHRLDMSIHYFFVPNRILWKKWQDFMRNKLTAGVPPAHPFIRIDKTVYDNSRLPDYMGIPEPDAAGLQHEDVNALPFAAVQLIWNEFFRDQNLIDPIVEPGDFLLSDGNNVANLSVLTSMRKRAWQHDYLTSCLPTPQSGPAVDLPIGQMQDVFVKVSGSPLGATIDNTAGFGPDPLLVEGEGADASPNIPADFLYADTSNLVNQATTINDFRTAEKLQQWYEKMERGGKRYIELLLAHFGVRSSDKSLQRPQYITGVKQPLSISEVLNTTGTDDAPQGNMAGHGIGLVKGTGGKYFSEEHGWIIGLASIMPVTGYQQGLERKWFRKNVEDYYWPTFDNLGEQAVLNKEVMAFRGNEGNETFGYIPRYAEYRFINNSVHGEFKTNLDFWHMGRIFDPGAPPALNQAFIECDATNRIFAVEDPTVDHYYVHLVNHVEAVRAMSVYATPSL